MQLDVGHSPLPVKEIIRKMESHLEIYWQHQAKYEKQRNLMQKIDNTNGNANLHIIIITDFGATMDLFAKEKNNSSINNYAVIDIFFIVQNWRKVKFKKRNEEGE